MPAAQKTKLIIEIDNTIKVAKLQVPLNLALGGVGGGIAPPGVAPRGRPTTRPGLQGADAGPRRMPTIVAGAALALTFTSGGFWLVRRRNGSAAVPFLVALLALGISGTVLWANGLLPPGPRPGPGFPNPGFPNNPPVAPAPVVLPQLILPADIRLDGNLLVEFTTDNSNAVKLIVNKAMVVRTTGVKKPPVNNAPGGRRPINVPRQPTPFPING